MDKYELINKFIKENLDLLTSSDFKRKFYKSKKRDFFITKYRAKGGSPKDGEIARSLLEYLIKYKQISDKIILKEFLELPFLKSNVHDSKHFISLIESEKIEPSVDIDYKKLKQEEYKQEVQKKFLEDIKQEVIESTTREAREEVELVKEELTEAIEKKKQEYFSLPSILDKMDFPEPEVNQIDEKMTLEVYAPWWRTLGLKKNPFPTQEGLNKIDSDLYETIVIKTEIFNKFLYWIRNEKQQLFRNAILFGGFGSGKTTLFDYLKKHFLDENILPIYIQLMGDRDFRSLYVNFQKEFYKKLCDYYEVIDRENPKSWLDSQNYEDAISILLQGLCEKKYSFIIIIDDLHKNRDTEEINSALKFITNLQVLTSKINREIKGIDAAFLISGSKDWERVIEKDPKFSGSYIKNHRMPQITDTIAIDMLNKRLNAFALNPLKDINVDKVFVRRIYRELDRQNEPITYRTFIKSVEEEFERGNFSILSSEPVELNKDLLLSIRTTLESYIDLRQSFNKLIFGGGIQKEENRRISLDLIVKTYLNNGISEDSSDFQENLFYFQKLMESNLIQKLKLGDNEFKWVLNPRLINANKYILQKYKCSMEDYLIQLYSTVPKKPKLEGPKESSRKQIRKIKEFLEEIPQDYKSLRELMLKSLDVHTKILETKDSVKEKDLPEDLKDNLLLAIIHITRALANFQEALCPDFNLKEIVEFWRTYWYQISEVTEFFNLIQDKNEMVNKIWYILSMYQDAYMNIFTHFKQIYAASKYFSIDINNLNAEEVILSNEVRNLWPSKYYFKIAKKLTEFMERKFRTSIFNIFSLLYNEERINRLDKSSINYIERCRNNDKERRRKISSNELHYLNRFHWRNFITGVHCARPGGQNWQEIFQYIFPDQSQKDIDNFLKVFGSLNLDSSHNKEESLSSEHQSEIFSFIMNCMNITRSLNIMYLYLLQDGIFAERDESDDTIRFYFSFHSFNDKRLLASIEIAEDEINKILNLFRTEFSIKVDLEDFKFINEVYNISYRKFMMIFAILLNKENKFSFLSLGKKLIIEKRIGSTYFFHIEDNH